MVYNPLSGAKRRKKDAKFGLRTFMAIAYSFSILSILGLGGVQISGFELSGVLASTGTGLAITWGAFLALITLFVTYKMSDTEIQKLKTYKRYSAGLTAAGVLLTALSPEVTDAITSTQGGAWAAFFVFTAGYTIIAGSNKG